VELLDGEQLRLAPSLMRFAEPVRGLDAPSDALKRLIERGEVSLGPGDADPEEASGEEPEPEDPEVDAAEGVDAAETAADDASEAGEDPPDALDAGDSLAAFLGESDDPGDSLAAFLDDPDAAHGNDVDAADAPLGDESGAPHEGDDAPRSTRLAAEPEVDDAEPPPAAPAPEPIELDWDTFPGEEA
jgi:chromosome partition protein MukE